MSDARLATASVALDCNRMSDSRLATASAARDRNYMPTHPSNCNFMPTHTNRTHILFCKWVAGEGGVACPIVGLQLHVSLLTATTFCRRGGRQLHVR